MILAFDVGNTTIVIAAVNEGLVEKNVRIWTEPTETKEDYRKKILTILREMNYSPEDFEGTIVSTVIPKLKTTLVPAIEELFHKEPLLISNDTIPEMKIKVDDPRTVAGDLLAGAVGVREFYGYPAILVDLGTAAKVIALDEHGDFCGLTISAGISMSLKALFSGTALLPEVSLSAPKHVIGTNTVDCIQSGTIYGTAAMVDGLIDRFEEEMGCKCTLVGTGGNSPLVVPLCRHKIQIDTDLLPKGLWKIYEEIKNEI